MPFQVRCITLKGHFYLVFHIVYVLGKNEFEL